MRAHRRKRILSAFTLIELLIVVAIIAILAAIGTANMRLAIERARKSADAANLHTIATALQTYYVDYQHLPPADRTAGPFMSHTGGAIGNGPAAGGSWDGLPWLLVEHGYLPNSNTLFTPKYLKMYSGGDTVGGNGYPRYHNFRYAYNSAAISSGWHDGGNGNVESGEVWIVRNLYLDALQGHWSADFPNYPADFKYPWGEGPWEEQLEHVMYADMSVRTVVGGTNESPAPGGP